MENIRGAKTLRKECSVCSLFNFQEWLRARILCGRLPCRLFMPEPDDAAGA
ncbi:hypothetical protein [Polaromonas glacialis]|uniref:hypothetical protein n=1 Tax=Polaromonas glacialis TaxID=866564 RepID=UPI0012EB994A|nr:hypothetical protein [Polaromonas glacialis]